MAKRSDLFSDELYDEMLAGGYIRKQNHPIELGLVILNYTEKAQYEKVWNECTLQCRGLIVDTCEGDVIGRPWPKFFNRDEKPDLIESTELVQIIDKMDGSLGIAYYYLDVDTSDLVFAIASRGSFDSDQARWATSWMRNTFPEWLPTARITPLFEIIYPENRIVLDYGDRAELVMLGGVHLDNGEIYGPLECKTMLAWPGKVAETLPECTIFQYLRSSRSSRPNAEGVVVRAGNRMVKIKQEDYVELHRTVTGLTNRRVWELLADGINPSILAGVVPDEFYAWIQRETDKLVALKEAWVSEVVEEFEALSWEYGRKVERKAFAEMAAPSPFRGALFRLYDGKPITDLAWKAVKPSIITKPYGGMADDA